MNNQYKNKTIDFETTPKFNQEIFFCVRIGTTHAELEDYSGEEISQQRQVQMSEDDPKRIKSFTKPYEYENGLIQRQNELIKELKKRIFNAERELIEKEKHIVLLENVLEEICKKLGMSPS